MFQVSFGASRVLSAMSILMIAALVLGGCREEGGNGPGSSGNQDGFSEGVGADAQGDSLLETTGDVADDGLPGDQVDPSDSTGDDGGGEVVMPQVIDCGALPAASSGTCDVVEGSTALRIRGTVLSGDDVFLGGEVFVSPGGQILCVDCDCSGEVEAAGATVITCADGIVSAGLINAHDHIGFGQNAPGDWGDERFDHRHDWRKGKNGHDKISVQGNASKENKVWCELRHLVSGATSVAGSADAMGFLRNLDGGDQHGLGQPEADYNTFPLGDSNGSQIASGCDYPKPDSVSSLEKVDCYHAHVAEGINAFARNEFLCVSSEENGGVDLCEANSAFVHCIGMLAVDGAELAMNQAAVVWSPRSNISLYGNTAPVTMFDAQGVLVGLGTDWSASGSMNMQRELACAASLNDTHYGGYFSTRDLWKMATINNAMLFAMDDAMGDLAPGLTADIAIFKAPGATDPYRAIIDAMPGDTVLVLRGGEPLFGDLDLMAAIPAGDEGCEEIPGGVCGVQKSICVERETGWSWSSLASANSGAYDLFFCGDPEGEPSCVPMRVGEYLGEATDADLDGDGLANADDNCPNVFNPVRPLDEGAQADHDKDGVGDSCDPCPLDADTDACSVANPNDKDQDGVDNAADNCPNDSNPLQEDGDDDGKGDACDMCPEDANPGNAPCPATIYDVKSGLMVPGTPVLVSGVVTAVAPPRFWIQVPEDAQDAELGARFSGIFVYVPSDENDSFSPPARGSLVSVSAMASEYYGQLQLENVTELEVLEAESAVPSPVIVSPEEVGTAGADRQAYEGVLVTVLDGVVTALNPPAGIGDQDPTNEYVLDDALRVNDYIYTTDPFPGIGDTMTVTGILRWANEDSKLEPRDEMDLISEMKLREFGPATVFVDEGEVDVLTTPPLVLRLTAPAPEGGLEVSLESADPEIVTVPASVLVAGGSFTADVPVTGVKGADEAVTLTAELALADGGSSSLTAEVLVVAEGRLPLPVSVDVPVLVAGQDASLTIGLDIPARAGGTVVTLSVAAAALVAAPADVTVPEGELQAEVVVSALAAGDTSLNVSTSAGDIDVDLSVADLPMTGLILSELFYNPPGEDSGKEWVEIYNGTGTEVDLSGYSLGWAGNTYTYATLQLSGSLAAGECFVVGGPETSSANHDPQYDQAVDFDPDVQNSGDTADAIALFNTPAAQISDGAVPIDALIYGGANSSDLKDETGSKGDVDVANTMSGWSLERHGDVWAEQEHPTPNNCNAALGL